MKGKESRKETKKAKSDRTTAKEQSDYQKDKARQTSSIPIAFNPKKK